MNKTQINCIIQVAGIKPKRKDIIQGASMNIIRKHNIIQVSV